VYHYLGGLRHVYWDHAKLGNMADARSALELPSVVASSKALIGASAAATVLAAAYTL
jgi:succinate dehydrogenase/fumarate reductase cytochrome b subunit